MSLNSWSLVFKLFHVLVAADKTAMALKFKFPLNLKVKFVFNVAKVPAACP